MKKELKDRINALDSEVREKLFRRLAAENLLEKLEMKSFEIVNKKNNKVYTIQFKAFMNKLNFKYD